MVVSGEWKAEEDGISRPMIEVLVSSSKDSSVEQLFLIDTGADCTVLAAALISELPLTPDDRSEAATLHGLGGESASVPLEATLTRTTTEGRDITIRGVFATLVHTSELDVCILGRDVLANFDVIVSRRRNEVLLLAGNHAYAVTG